MLPLEGAETSQEATVPVWRLESRETTQCCSFTFSRDLNAADGFVRGGAGLQHSSNSFSQPHQRLRLLTERADQYLGIHLKKGSFD